MATMQREGRTAHPCRDTGHYTTGCWGLQAGLGATGFRPETRLCGVWSRAFSPGGDITSPPPFRPPKTAPQAVSRRSIASYCIAPVLLRSVLRRDCEPGLGSGPGFPFRLTVLLPRPSSPVRNAPQARNSRKCPHMSKGAWSPRHTDEIWQTRANCRAGVRCR
jgi:hypothetical protein